MALQSQGQGPGPSRRDDILLVCLCLLIIGGVAAYLAMKFQWL